LLEPRRRIDKALWAVIMTAYITGTSTRKVDDLVKALGSDSGVSRSTVSRICKGIDADVSVLRHRALDHQPFVYVWLDATYVHVREHGQVVSKAVVIATGLRADGHREVLGVDVGDSENETFWTEFLRDLKDRGLAGVRLVISDAHAGLNAAISANSPRAELTNTRRRWSGVRIVAASHIPSVTGPPRPTSLRTDCAEWCRSWAIPGSSCLPT
jgi:putative transposase